MEVPIDDIPFEARARSEKLRRRRATRPAGDRGATRGAGLGLGSKDEGFLFVLYVCHAQLKQKHACEVVKGSSL